MHQLDSENNLGIHYLNFLTIFPVSVNWFIRIEIEKNGFFCIVLFNDVSIISSKFLRGETKRSGTASHTHRIINK